MPEEKNAYSRSKGFRRWLLQLLLLPIVLIFIVLLAATLLIGPHALVEILDGFLGIR